MNNIRDLLKFINTYPGIGHRAYFEEGIPTNCNDTFKMEFVILSIDGVKQNVVFISQYLYKEDNKEHIKLLVFEKIIRELIIIGISKLPVD